VDAYYEVLLVEEYTRINYARLLPPDIEHDYTGEEGKKRKRSKQTGSNKEESDDKVII